MISKELSKVGTGVPSDWQERTKVETGCLKSSRLAGSSPKLRQAPQVISRELAGRLSGADLVLQFEIEFLG